LDQRFTALCASLIITINGDVELDRAVNGAHLTGGYEEQCGLQALPISPCPKTV
jgi:hypothetical protein